ncbi:MAG: hypothetical protein FJ253_04175 [Phycisphaerae bacterium]|nr:hypothetical protein [Phycisphaerae bacterium]
MPPGRRPQCPRTPGRCRRRAAIRPRRRRRRSRRPARRRAAARSGAPNAAPSAVPSATASEGRRTDRLAATVASPQKASRRSRSTK